MAMTEYEDSDPLEGMSEEQLQQLVALGLIPDKQDALATQLAQAAKLRNQGAPKGYDTGRVYTAASPLEHFASALERGMAGREMKDIYNRRDELLKQQQSGRGEFLRAMYGKKLPSFIEKPEIDPESFKMPKVTF